uniref:Uncharacterized protein n=1 Tax=Accipiter nisus TaxID=211598 RepID=A0A8B9RY54_9AVES
MGKSESQMDIVEKSTKSGKKSWSFVAIGLAVLLLLMTCAVVALVILYASSRGVTKQQLCSRSKWEIAYYNVKAFFLKKTNKASQYAAEERETF